MLKVLLLSWEYPPKSVGGLAQHVFHLSRALAKQQVEVHVLTIGDKNSVAIEEKEGVTVHRVAPYSLNAPDFRTWILHLNFAMLEYAVTLNCAVKGFDLIHAHDWLTGYAGRALKHAFRIPLLATIHATEWGRNHGLHNDNQRYISDVEWWLSYEAWKVIVCSQYMENELQRIFGLPGDKIAVIPNGVNSEDFVSTSEKRILSPHEKHVFFVGRLVREKGVHVLIDAIPKVLSHFPEARFIIAGTGPYEGELKNMARAKGLEHRIYFAGYINDRERNQFLAQCSVAVFPSLYEPFGIVALEGMAAGVPVVVSDTGGLSEIIQHGVDGMKCYTGSPDSLADNIMAILGDQVLASRLRQNAYDKVRKNFNWTGVAKETIGVYQDVLQQSQNSDWRTDTWSALDPMQALYAGNKKFGISRLFNQKA